MTSPPVKHNPFRRRQFVIYGFQSRYALIVVLISVFITGIAGLMIFRLFVGSGGPVTLLEADGMVDRGVVWLAVGVGALMLCAFLLFYGIVIVASHRVAGPILLMTRYMTDLSQGRYPRMRNLRENDELKDFFALFRQTIDRLRARDQEEAKILGDAVTALASLNQGPASQEALASLRKLRDSKVESSRSEPQGAVASEVSSGQELPVPTPAR